MSSQYPQQAPGIAPAPTARPVDFGTAIVVAFRNYARFDGTASLSEFWWFTLFTVLVSAGLGTLDQLMVVGAAGVGSVLGGLWSLAVLLPSLAVAVRRLRDGGNRWTQLFWLLLPIAGLIIIILRLCDPSRTLAAAPDQPRI
ncbi:DUF805 domain-containing protein [Herbiconiux moechotypicola]|uniref:DUF805 domain-containing protein n=1 Tax=Herbiconiux moechotypicola TaxID=637393 RepID=A0ABN3DDT1_9MICO|nr:DUF805 domain-containing protein [Herbiconiux moechotypicola]MCS5729185.1 DUF805 domain-containing protein [Herbiconiux moechotypicola]